MYNCSVRESILEILVYPDKGESCAQGRRTPICTAAEPIKREDGGHMNKSIMSIAGSLGITFAAAAATAQSPGWVFERQSPSANISEAGGGPGGRLEACSDGDR